MECRNCAVGERIKLGNESSNFSGGKRLSYQ